MSIPGALRRLYIRSTNVTHGYQGMDQRLVSFYRAWSKVYDATVRLDPAYQREMHRLVDEVVGTNDSVLDLGAGTGLGTVRAARVAQRVVALDLSEAMLARLRRKAHRGGLGNIEYVTGSFPQALHETQCRAGFSVVFSSFAIVHWPPEARPQLYQQIFSVTRPGGRLALFSARGEEAPAFEQRGEMMRNVEAAGFVEVRVSDRADIYRTLTAVRPETD